MTAVIIHSDFGVQEEEICHSCHLFCFDFPCSNGATQMTILHATMDKNPLEEME